MAGYQHRGVGLRDEKHEKALARDTRGWPAKVADWLKAKSRLCTALATMAAASMWYPMLATPLLAVALVLFWHGMRQRDACPLKMPIHSLAIDPNEMNLKTGVFGDTAGGIFYLGVERDNDKKQVWLTNSDCRQHFMIFGTTGSGKTELLLGFGANALAWASGFLMVDGKGDVSVWAKVYALARRYGRTDDLLVLNFMEDDDDGSGKLPSNTLNPFASGGADVLTQMVVSLMDESGGDGGMWKGRATAMFTGVMRAMVFLRNNGLLDLDVGAIRDHLNLRRIIDLADDKKYPEMPANIRKSVTSYLTSLPGYQPEKGYKQAQTTLDQHGFLEMQFTRIMGSLADVYGHIFMTPFGEVDMFDVVLNRRILMVMLPALGKSKDEVANLGKIVVASLKRMMGATLGNQIEGTWLDVVDRRMTTSPSPFVVILDEVGYYCVDGMDLMAAQARSLGFAMVYAAQDINGMKNLNEKVPGSIIANTNTKIMMRLSDVETAEIAIKLAGKAYRPMSLGMNVEAGEVASSYIDDKQARMELMDRINQRDLVGQKEGEMHIIQGDWVVRTKAIFADPVSSLDTNKLKLSANHFIKIPKPKPEELEEDADLPSILDDFIDPGFAEEREAEAAEALERAMSSHEPTDQVVQVATTYASARAANPAAPAAEAMCAAMAHVVNLTRQGVAPFERRAQGGAAYGGVDLLDRDGEGGPFGTRAARPAAGSRIDRLNDDPFAGPHDDGRDGSLRGELGAAGFDFHDRPARGDEGRGFRDAFEDDLAAPPRRTRPASRLVDDLAASPRRPVPLKGDVGHEFDVGGRGLHNAVGEDDAVFRTISDLDYDPTRTTEQAVADTLRRSTGAPSYDRDNTAPPAAIDAVAYDADQAMAPPPSADEAEDAPPPPAGDYLSSFLSELADDEKGKDGKAK